MAELTRIALVMDTAIRYSRGVLEGFSEFAADKAWTYLLNPHALEGMARLRRWQPDGIVGYFPSRREIGALRRLGKPAVSLASPPGCPWPPRVGNTEDAGGRMAAEHLLSRGLLRFGYVDWAHGSWLKVRRESFIETVRAAGGTCSVFWLDESHDYFDELRAATKRGGGRAAGAAQYARTAANERRMAEWLRALPKPVGIAGATDDKAWQVAQVCQQVGLHVPEDVAIIGHDDDIQCRFSRPTLSSVAMDSHRVGYEAADLLWRMMGGQTPPQEQIEVPPLGVVARQSTDLLDVRDADVMMAVRFIRDHTAVPIRVREVVEHVSINRRGLERKFARSLGRSIAGEIRRVRVLRAQELLASTNLTMENVASRCGFNSHKQFCIAFRARTGMVPRLYRRQFRRGGKVEA